MEKVKLLKGDNMELLKTLEDNSVDSVVSDCPYGLSFMNKKWDYDVPSVELWKEVLRVLKPGGHVLSFGGTRTYHRMVVNMEDAGFEIRDSISYMYGSGFPKSHNIGKAIDKIQGNEREVVGKEKAGKTSKAFNDYEYRIEDEIYSTSGKYDKTKGNSDWEGWGTSLKPSMELICLARKPLSEKSIAENVLKHGTGGINIDDCRVEYENTPNPATNPKYRKENGYKLPERGQESNGAVQFTSSKNEINTEGRFPANTIMECICDEVIAGETIKGNENYKWSNTNADGDLFTQRGKYTPRTETTQIHTNPECPCYILDKQSGTLKSGYVAPHHKTKDTSWYGASGKYSGNSTQQKDLVGGASRFFYTAKVSKKERNMGLDGFEEKPSQLNSGGIGRKTSVEKRMEINGENAPVSKNSHPTIKPVNLMTYLCRLITPPNGVILDMYMGSGSTGISALLEGFNFIGMEKDEEYFNIAEARINNYEKYRQFVKK